MPHQSADAKGIAIASRRVASGERKKLGICHDQQFYAIRHLSGKALQMPFESTAFNAMIHVAVPHAEPVLYDVALELLRHGMRNAVCHGYEAERLTEIIDELVDEHNFSYDNRTVFASSHEDEPLTETLAYFILPNDLAETSLIVVLGDEAAFRNMARQFGQVTTGLRERIFADVC